MTLTVEQIRDRVLHRANEHQHLDPHTLHHLPVIPPDPERWWNELVGELHLINTTFAEDGREHALALGVAEDTRDWLLRKAGLL